MTDTAAHRIQKDIIKEKIENIVKTYGYHMWRCNEHIVHPNGELGPEGKNMVNALINEMITLLWD